MVPRDPPSLAPALVSVYLCVCDFLLFCKFNTNFSYFFVLSSFSANSIKLACKYVHSCLLSIIVGDCLCCCLMWMNFCNSVHCANKCYFLTRETPESQMLSATESLHRHLQTVSQYDHIQQWRQIKCVLLKKVWNLGFLSKVILYREVCFPLIRKIWRSWTFQTIQLLQQKVPRDFIRNVILMIHIKRTC